MKALFRYKYEALLAAQSAAGYTYESTADAGELEAQEPGLPAAGEVSCLRSSDGDVFAWIEKSPRIYYAADDDGNVSDPTLNRAKLAREYCDDEIVEFSDDDDEYLALINYLEK